MESRKYLQGPLEPLTLRQLNLDSICHDPGVFEPRGILSAFSSIGELHIFRMRFRYSASLWLEVELGGFLGGQTNLMVLVDQDCKFIDNLLRAASRVPVGSFCPGGGEIVGIVLYRQSVCSGLNHLGATHTYTVSRIKITTIKTPSLL